MKLPPVHQQDFAKGNEIHPKHLATLRRSVGMVEGEDFWRERNSVVWTGEIAAKVAKVLPELKANNYVLESVDAYETPIPEHQENLMSTDDTPEAPAPPSNTITIRVIEQARNPNFVYADLNGKRISVKVGKKISSRLPGKKITIDRDTLHHIPS